MCASPACGSLPCALVLLVGPGVGCGDWMWSLTAQPSREAAGTEWPLASADLGSEPGCVTVQCI